MDPARSALSVALLPSIICFLTVYSLKNTPSVYLWFIDLLVVWLDNQVDYFHHYYFIVLVYL